jgi:hypothetical protein
MIRSLLALTLLTAAAFTTQAQQEGPTATQALVAIASKSDSIPTANDLVLKVNNRQTEIESLVPVRADGAQVAILIDDGLRVSVARELGTIGDFIKGLRPGTEVFVGYMQNGRVIVGQNFTTDYAAAVEGLRIPVGSPGISASPYFCLSDFVKKWPEDSSSRNTPKARFVLMITNGVDPYNGSTSLMNQNSPYVEAAITDSQRAGVAVYSMYFSDAGIRGGRASFSGQSYLSKVAEATGGTAYYQGTGNPVSMEPYLKQFQRAISETYIATFNAPGEKSLVQLKVSPKPSRTQVRAPAQVRPGTQLQ